jgi:hypothetical protein
MSESPYFNLLPVCTLPSSYRRRFPGALPTGRQSKRPDRWVLNRHAKAPLHFIYRMGELDSLERWMQKAAGIANAGVFSRAMDS